MVCRDLLLEVNVLGGCLLLWYRVLRRRWPLHSCVGVGWKVQEGGVSSPAFVHGEFPYEGSAAQVTCLSCSRTGCMVEAVLGAELTPELEKPCVCHGND